MSAAGPRPLFLDMQAVERGASANTLDAYRRDLDDLALFLVGAGTDLAAADTTALRAYLADLSARGFKATTIARRLSALRQFYRFPVCRGASRGRSGGGAGGAEARTRSAQGADAG